MVYDNKDAVTAFQEEGKRRYGVFCLKRLFKVLTTVIVGTISNSALADSSGRFSNYEIRVIQPREFTKAAHLELGGGIASLANQSFVYSLLGYLSGNYHFNETLGLELQAAYGSSFDKADKTLLSDHFKINTIILRTESLLNARLLWTPAYGKVHMPSGDIVYFDTYLSVGGGMTGVKYTYDHCERPGDYPAETAAKISEPPPPSHKSYSTIVAGLGQRYFISKSSSIKVGVDWQHFQYPVADGACSPAEETDGVRSQNNIFLMFAWSKYL